MTNELTLHTVSNEARVLDTDLASRLGMEVPRKVRQNIIEANRDELETYGELRMERIQTGRGRPATAFYLNEEQALLVCMFSKTEKAAAVRKQVIATFMAHRRGQLVVAPQVAATPTSFAEALRLAADEAETGISQPLNNPNVPFSAAFQQRQRLLIGWAVMGRLSLLDAIKFNQHSALLKACFIHH